MRRNESESNDIERRPHLKSGPCAFRYHEVVAFPADRNETRSSASPKSRSPFRHRPVRFKTFTATLIMREFFLVVTV